MGRVRFLLTGFCLVALLGCTKELQELEKDGNQPSDKSVIYKIKKGEHYSNHVFEAATSDTIKFKAFFDSSAIYQLEEISNQTDINKLFGTSDCNSSHQNNSARFGWRWFNDRIEILVYTYINGARHWQYLDTVCLNSWNVYELILLPDAYIFRLNDTKTEIPRACSGSLNRYLLFPYFGGDEPAPHDIYIRIIKE